MIDATTGTIWCAGVCGVSRRGECAWLTVYELATGATLCFCSCECVRSWGTHRSLLEWRLDEPKAS
jgi:hypothetical protein